jgi:proliferating cell nuclear antigen PCNA
MSRNKQEAPDSNITTLNDHYEQNMPNDNYLLEASTIQTDAFKLIVEALKEALKDVNIKWKKVVEGEPNSGGMSIVAYNPRSAVLIKVKIPASSFDKFNINPPNGLNEFQIGVNMKSFNTIMKMARNTDGISLILNEHNKNELTFVFENGDTNIRSKYNLKLLELPDEGIHLPTTQFPFKIIILSDDFYKIIHDSSNLSDKINIKFINTKEIQNTIVFSSKGDFADGEITLTESTKGVQIIKTVNDNKDIIVKGTYDLKNLSLFSSKCQSSRSYVELYFKNNFPLIVKYQIANLGHVLLVLSTCNDDNIIEEDSESSDEEQG